MWVKNRHSRTDGTKPGLFTTRVNCSRTAGVGTGSATGLAGDFPDDEGGGTCLFPPLIMLHDPSATTPYGGLRPIDGQKT